MFQCLRETKGQFSEFDHCTEMTIDQTLTNDAFIVLKCHLTPNPFWFSFCLGSVLFGELNATSAGSFWESAEQVNRRNEL